MKKCDVVVLGGTIYGCFAALHAAKKGFKVVLVEKSIILGKEFSAYHHAWIGEKGIKTIPLWMKDLFIYSKNPETIDEGQNNEIPLYLGHIRTQLLKLLTDSGVEVLFVSQPAGFLVDRESVRGVMLANKYGKQVQGLWAEEWY
jgi:flavin-dependent dehydrogenase